MVKYLTQFRIGKIMADRLGRRIALGKILFVIVVQRLKVILINGESLTQILQWRMRTKEKARHVPVSWQTRDYAVTHQKETTFPENVTLVTWTLLPNPGKHGCILDML